MKRETDPPSRLEDDTLPDTSNFGSTTLTDLIDEMDRAAFRRALELRDTRLAPHGEMSISAHGSAHHETV